MPSGGSAIWAATAILLIPNAQQAAISPEGKMIAFCRGSDIGYFRVWISALDDPSSARALTDDSDGLWSHTDPAWSPDGKTICYGTRHGLWTVPLSGGAARPLTREGEADSEPMWSPDGRYVYFASWRSGSLAIWRVPSEGGTPQRITTGTALESHPDISSDGKRLCYSTGDTRYQTFILDRKTGTETLLRALASDTMAAISPDNGKIVFTSNRGVPNYNLWILPLSAGVPLDPPYRLTNPPGNASHPTFSPDGNWIAFYRIIREARDIWIAPVSGGQPIQFTNEPSRDMHPAWSPDGRKIAFIAEEGGIGKLMVAELETADVRARQRF